MARYFYKAVLEPKCRNRLRGGIASPEIEGPGIEAMN